jgi:hypothetical protein
MEVHDCGGHRPADPVVREADFQELPDTPADIATVGRRDGDSLARGSCAFLQCLRGNVGGGGTALLSGHDHLRPSNVCPAITARCVHQAPEPSLCNPQDRTLSVTFQREAATGFTAFSSENSLLPHSCRTI